MPTIDAPSSSPILIDGPIDVQQAPARVRHYFMFSLFSAICLCPATGLVALAYSLKSSAKADVKFHDKARLYSRRALLWNLISIVLALCSFFMVLAFCYYFNEMVKVYGNSADSIYQKQRYNEINNEINRMIQSFTNDK
ncbi:unnamed protein product [Rotaria sordida]|uniref:Interferon-induced transmembrane protein n=1 Tax=Rotaria sordida TaxID=392033 RepID=A0A814XE85_9BILA|nr:unnamed protein product [Rotaria sordida]CAF3585287.1 unnamed protein product [Rotaria sordida]CAF3593333.1 unnamed protein product [Rotaria sordida]